MRRQWRTPRTLLGPVLVVAMLVVALLVAVGTGTGTASRRQAGVQLSGVRARGTQPASTASDWPMVGHDSLHTGVSSDVGVTAADAAQLSTVWSSQLGGTSSPVLASPAVVYDATLQQNLVYEIDVTGLALALDASTGAVVWSQQLANGKAGTGLADGDVASPTVFGNTVYYGTTGQLYALDATTGAVQCSFQLPTAAHQTAPGIIDSSPVVGDYGANGPVVYFGDKGQTESSNHGHEWAVTGVGNTAGACQEVWSFNGFAKAAGSWSSPALAQDATGEWLLVFGSSQNDDAVYALDATTGQDVWRFQTVANGPDQDVGAGPTISPPGTNGIADGVVYIDGKNRVEYALDLGTGAQLWSFDMAANAQSKQNSVSITALDGGTAYVAYDVYVYALDAVTGALLGRYQAGRSTTILSSPAISGPAGAQVLFIGTTAGIEYAIDLATGSLLWKHKLGGAIFSSAAVSNGTVYVASATGYVTALAAAAPPSPVQLTRR